MKKTILTFLMASALASTLLAEPIGVKNGGFEDGSQDGPPNGWFVPPSVAADGWSARLVADGAKEGRRCAMIERKVEGEPQAFGNLTQSLSAESARGRVIRFSAMVRHSGGAGSRSQLWFRVDRPNQQPGFFDNCADRPATTDEWRNIEIVGEVAEDALTLNFGLMTFGKSSTGRLDDVKLEILGDAPKAEAPRALTDHGLANVTAFVRLLGYVRYFHPGDQAAALTPGEWDRFAVDGLREVEPATDATDLAARMTKVFQPIAPTVAIAAGKTAPPVQLPRGSHVRFWQHSGYGAGEAMAGGASVYQSLRIRQSTPNIRSGDGIRDPGDPWMRDIGGAVACSVPLTLYDDGEATLPRTAARPAPPSITLPLSSRDRAVRLAAVASAWNVMQHFFPYFDIIQTDWNAALSDGLRSAANDPDEAAFLRTLKRLGAALHDGHCRVSGPGAPAEMHPALSLAWADGKLCVAHSGVPAVAPGDALLEIDGVPVEQAVKDLLALYSVPSAQAGQFRAVLSLLAGSPHSTARLVIEPYAAPGTRLEVTALRDRASAFDVRPKRERSSSNSATTRAKSTP